MLIIVISALWIARHSWLQPAANHWLQKHGIELTHVGDTRIGAQATHIGSAEVTLRNLYRLRLSGINIDNAGLWAAAPHYTIRIRHTAVEEVHGQTPVQAPATQDSKLLPALPVTDLLKALGSVPQLSLAIESLSLPGIRDHVSATLLRDTQQQNYQLAVTHPLHQLSVDLDLGADQREGLLASVRFHPSEPGDKPTLHTTLELQKQKRDWIAELRGGASPTARISAGRWRLSGHTIFSAHWRFTDNLTDLSAIRALQASVAAKPLQATNADTGKTFTITSAGPVTLRQLGQLSLESPFNIELATVGPQAIALPAADTGNQPWPDAIRQIGLTAPTRIDLALPQPAKITASFSTGITEIIAPSTSVSLTGSSSGSDSEQLLEIDTGEVACHPMSRQCRVQDVELPIDWLTLPNLELTDGKLQVRELRVEGDVAHIDFSSRALSARSHGKTITAPEVNGSIRLAGDQLHGQLNLSVAQHARLKIEGTHSLEKHVGEVTFAVPSIEFSEKQSLANLVKGLPVNLLHGTLSGKGAVDWSPHTLKATLDLDASQLAITHRDSFATGLSTSGRIEYDGSAGAVRYALPLTIKKFDPGIPIENIKMRVVARGSNKLPRIEQFGARLLDGDVSAPLLVPGDEGVFPVTVNGLRLGALGDALAMKGLSMTGTVDLQLPLSFTDGGVIVEDGKLRSHAPGGELRYYGAFSPGTLASNAQLALLAGALEDYHFRELTGSIDYPTSGDLRLGLRLVGKSASLDKNRDLILNLNVENNILQMLRSLQASRDLTESLEDSLR
ncbi:intermembrane phospholipid transport protein YdbH family protein [Biformimicrobium ophioploci]|uniref:Dicarboxylate transport domain-containing protein n=1 Tax=Biformimicrobium ophioploci TaxID=3036711 RepID=A0ABQ6LXU5_9GAMM|nr:YdbH domain-containing protein [Microbulbifer sp. NKW57]GMG86905.1 hypothetical protein MNKW57_12260 [Microbulbifer sp. NKW57]